MKFICLLSVLILSVTEVMAHEGHDHSVGQLQPPKGGIVRSLEELHAELVVKDQKIFLYAYDLKGRPLDIKAIKASATVTLPRGKPAVLMLKTEPFHWEAEFDAKGAHRYTLAVTLERGAHKDTLKYTVEPKK